MHSSRILLLIFLLAPTGCNEEDPEPDPNLSVRSECSTDSDCLYDEICKPFDNIDQYNRCVCRPGSLWCDCIRVDEDHGYPVGQEFYEELICQDGLECQLAGRRECVNSFSEDLPPIQCDSDSYCREDEQCVLTQPSDQFRCECRPGASWCRCTDEGTCEDGLSCLENPEPFTDGQPVVCR